MLVLTRKSDESIRLGEDIKITVLEIRGNQVKLGIDAPSGVMIYREELYERIRSENISASRVSLEDFLKIKEGLK